LFNDHSNSSNNGMKMAQVGCKLTCVYDKTFLCTTCAQPMCLWWINVCIWHQTLACSEQPVIDVIGPLVSVHWLVLLAFWQCVYSAFEDS